MGEEEPDATIRVQPTALSVAADDDHLIDTIRADLHTTSTLDATIRTSDASSQPPVSSTPTSLPTTLASSSPPTSSLAPRSSSTSPPTDSTASSSSPDFGAPNPLPSFASPEAIALDAALHSKRQQLFATQSTIEQTQERLTVMTQHLQHVQAEYQHARQLLQNKQRDTATVSDTSWPYSTERTAACTRTRRR